MKLSVTAYIYCDYCASLIDFDLSKFLGISGSALYDTVSSANEVANASDEERQMEMANEVLERSKNLYSSDVLEHKKVSDQFSPLMQAAIESGEREKYEEYCEKVQQDYVVNFANKFSPRVGDPEYQKKFVHYLVKTETERNFHPGILELTENIGKRTAAIQWDMSNPSAIAIPVQDFRELCQSYLSFLDGCNNRFSEMGLFELDPEKTGPELTKKISFSTFVQAWISYLKESDVKEVLKELNLLDEYHPLPKVKFNERICGQCGNKLLALDNSKKTLCECCGFILNTEDTKFDCPGCSAPVSMPVDKTELNCPSCNTLLARN